MKKATACAVALDMDGLIYDTIRERSISVINKLAKLVDLVGE